MAKLVSAPSAPNYTPISDEELARIAQETIVRDATEPRVQQVHYNAVGGTLELQLRDGTMIRTEARSLSALAHATDGELADVKIVSNGAALHWNELDVQMTTPAFLSRVLGMRTIGEVARLAGSRSTPAKSAASRLNGARGGRPRKKAPA